MENLFNLKELNDLSPKDRHLFLINDLIEVLREKILDYLIMYKHESGFDLQLEEFLKSLANIYEKVYNKESDVLKNKREKDFWLLTVLARNEVAREAFNAFIIHTH